MFVISALPQNARIRLYKSSAALDPETRHQPQKVAARLYTLAKKMQMIRHCAIGWHRETSKRAFRLQ
jgi:hypothetical protein